MIKKVRICVYPGNYDTSDIKHVDTLISDAHSGIQGEDYRLLEEIPAEELSVDTHTNIIEACIAKMQSPEYIMNNVRSDPGVLILIGRSAYMLIGIKDAIKLDDYVVVPAWPSLAFIKAKLAKRFVSDLKPMVSKQEEALRRLNNG